MTLGNMKSTAAFVLFCSGGFGLVFSPQKIKKGKYKT